jgi:gluconate 2-dehydrogenase subunit 3-like protein
MLSRRTFVSWLSGFGAALGIGVRARAGEANAATITAPQQANTLDTATITRLAEAVLPGELGDAGFARTGRGFTQWIGGYRAGAELVHPYGSANIQRTGESPAGRWRTQLASLDRDARAKHQRSFAALTRDQRRELVVAALGSERINRLPDPLDANHVAIALVAWYFGQPEASNLCYRAKIDRNQCRPLVNAPRQPLPLARGQEFP